MKSKLLLLIVCLPTLVASYAWLVVTPEEGKLLPALAVGLVLLVGTVGTILIRRNEDKTSIGMDHHRTVQVPPHHKYPLPLPVNR